MKIAVIDADPDIVQTLHYALPRYDAEVFAANSLPQLIQAAPDVVFIETTHHLFAADHLQHLRQGSVTAVVALDTIQGFGQATVADDVDFWLPKPFTAEQIKGIMEKLCAV